MDGRCQWSLPAASVVGGSGLTVCLGSSGVTLPAGGGAWQFVGKIPPRKGVVPKKPEHGVCTMYVKRSKISYFNVREQDM